MVFCRDGILLELPLSVGDEVAQGGSAAMVMGKNGFTMSDGSYILA